MLCGTSNWGESNPKLYWSVYDLFSFNHHLSKIEMLTGANVGNNLPNYGFMLLLLFRFSYSCSFSIGAL